MSPQNRLSIHLVFLMVILSCGNPEIYSQEIPETTPLPITPKDIEPYLLPPADNSTESLPIPVPIVPETELVVDGKPETRTKNELILFDPIAVIVALMAIFVTITAVVIKRRTIHITK